MSIMYCEKHDRRWDSDKLEDCPMCEAEPLVVGHKTFNDGYGFRHEPLLESEANEIMRRVEIADAQRKELMPDEQAAIRMFFEAWQRLKELGWREAVYCPKDGSWFDAIEPGSTGINSCRYSGEWPKGTWWVAEYGDLYPSRPALYREKTNTTTSAPVKTTEVTGWI